MTGNKLIIVPGISTNINKDNHGQQYVSIKERMFADIWVVGRAITQHADKGTDAIITALREFS